MVKSRALVIALVASLALAACGDDDDSDASSATTAADSAVTSAAGAGTTAAAATSLAGVCPETIVVQSNWWPEPDHGLFYELIGADGTIDANAATYSGPLLDTGVNLEIRAGGPAVGFQTASAQMYQDPDILLGMVGTDEAIVSAATQPTTAVLAWYAKNPQIFMWGDPALDFESVADIGASGETVLAFDGSYLDVFEAQGLLQPEQIDTSYQGDPSRFLAADGKIVQQGFVTSEPYFYENELPEWNKPVEFLLLDEDYPVYQNAIVVRSDALEENSECLTALVPILQQSAIDYVNDPAATNAVLLDYVGQLTGGFVLTEGGVADAVQKQLDLGIVGNGTDGVFGSFDDTRVQKLLDDLVPVLTASGTEVPEGLSTADLVTNEFLDPSISL